MNCPNCRQQVEDKVKFCPKCGHEINMQEINDNITDDDLINAYIGKNQSKILNQKISINALLLGPYYLLYRKMYLLGIIVLLLQLILGFIPNLIVETILIIIINILIAVKFSNIYKSHVTKQIDKIKLQNQDKTKSELLQIIASKGGTILIIPILAAVIFPVVVYLVFLLTNNIYSKNDAGKVENLSVNLPSELTFYEKYSSDHFKQYYIENDKDNCEVNIVASDSAALLYKGEEKSWLESNIYLTPNDQYNGIEEKMINNKKWYTATVISNDEKDYYYYIIDGSMGYEVKIEIRKDSGICTKVNKEISESLKIQ